MNKIIFLFLFTINLFGAVTLTRDEQNYLKQYPIAKVGAGPDWAPFDFVGKDGLYKGVAKDYLDLISKKTGLKFDIVVDKWSNNLQKVKDAKIDILHAVYFTKERTKFLDYTPAYFDMLDYFFIREGLDVNSIEDLNHKRVAIPKGYAHGDILKKEFPLIEIVEVDTFSDAIDALLQKKADILFDTFASIEYALKKDNITTIHAFKSYRVEKPIRLHMATRKDASLLLSILTKGLNAITLKERKKIDEKWLVKIEEVKDYTLFYQVGTILFLLVIWSLYWNSKLSKEIKIRKKIEEELSIEKDNFKILFEKVSDGNLIIQNGVFVNCNAAAMRMLGVDSISEVSNSTPSKWSPHIQPDGMLSELKAQKEMEIRLKEKEAKIAEMQMKFKAKEAEVARAELASELTKKSPAIDVMNMIQ